MGCYHAPMPDPLTKPGEIIAAVSWVLMLILLGVPFLWSLISRLLA